jgi:hypothetical protein
MVFKKYVKFMDEDRDYSASTFVWKPEEGYEECWSFGTRLSWGERQILVEFLQAKGVAADLDEYSGEIYILPNRKSCAKE